jgi:RND superfamily putative drug exporter
MNLLSIGAAYGVIVAIFQWGWAKDVVGIGKEGPIEAWVPMMLFAIVFGLSMDYEVFLLSRIKEEYDRTGDNALAVADGLSHTARVITAAALIMITVFGSFILGDQRTETRGLGPQSPSRSATVVRSSACPWNFSAANWWLPRWLQHLIPKVRAD